MKQEIERYLSKYQYKSLNIKAAFFDMDGVLFNSMPYHAEAWKRTINAHGIPFELHDAYVCEGRTGASVINEVFLKHKGREATEEEIHTRNFLEKSFLTSKTFKKLYNKLCLFNDLNSLATR